VTITETSAPANAAGAVTRALYRSTTAGQLGTLVSAVTLPHEDQGRTNGVALYYTLRVSDGSTTADTPQVSATPQAAGGTSALILGANFNDNSLGGFAPYHDLGETISVINDPTGSGRGKVLRIPYNRPTTSTRLDINANIHPPDQTPGLLGSEGLTFGGRGYFAGDFYLPQGTLTGAAPEQEQRKLVYPKFGDYNSGAYRHDWAVIAWGRTTSDPRGPGMDLQLISGTKGVGGEPDYRQWQYGIAPLSFATWYRLEMEWQFNTAGLPDAWITIYLDGVQVYHRANFMLAAPHPTQPGLFNRLYNFNIGDQKQADSSTNLAIFSEGRLWDNIEIRTARP
jgi:hypothetical protein